MNKRRLTPLLVVAAGLLAYHNSFTGSYFHDDYRSILENPTIRQLWPIWKPLSPPHEGLWNGRPLINVSLAINYALGGYHVWGYHALNLTVHILAGLTLLGIVRRTLLQPPLRERFGAAANELALTVAVLWTVHPLQTESVTYIIQRAESIMGLFYLLTLYCFIRGTESVPVQRPVGTRCSASQWPRGSAALPSALWFTLSVVACTLGMASKEVMVSAPLMALLYDRVFVSGSFRETWRRHRPLYLGLTAAWILLGILLASAGSFSTASTNARNIGLSWWQYLATQPGVILFYLRLCVWPSPLALTHAWPIANSWKSILPPAMAVGALLWASAWAWRKNPVWGFVGAWFFLILAISSSFIPLVDLVYEHRMYLPLAAVVSVTVMGSYSVAGRPGLVLLMVAAIGLGYLTWQRNQAYRRNPHYNLALALDKTGQMEEAVVEFERALQFTPDDPETHYNLGLALRQTGRTQEAVGHFQQALRITPDFPEGHYNLGVALMGVNRNREAAEHLERALRLKPNFVAAHNNLGVCLARLGKITEARANWEDTLRIEPNHVQAHNNLGLALIKQGKVQEAIGHWEQAVRIQPDYAEAHYNLGLALMGLGQVPAAVAHWEQAVRIKPDYVEAQNNLGDALAKMGRTSEAIEHWEQALRITPNLAEAHFNLGVAFEQAGRLLEAIEHYEQALRINPDYSQAKQNLSRAQAAH